MSIAEEVASLWTGVAQKPQEGQEKSYYAGLLRRLMQSKKQLEETGRKYTILPNLRELTRRIMVRIPAEHVSFLEVSVFDLISNPLKKNLQPYVSEFSRSGSDFELVSWFVRHATKEPSLALDVKVLQAWLDQNKPVQAAEAVVCPAVTEEKNTLIAESKKTENAEVQNQEKNDAAGAAGVVPSGVSSSDVTAALHQAKSGGTSADRVFDQE